MHYTKIMFITPFRSIISDNKHELKDIMIVFPNQQLLFFFQDFYHDLGTNTKTDSFRNLYCLPHGKKKSKYLRIY